MQVINRHHLKTAGWPEGALYVGRGTVLGNPFEIGKDGSREEVVARFSVWLDERVAAGDAAVLTALVGAQRASALVCSCAPAPCHATRIAEVAPTIRLHGLPPSRCYAGIGSRNTPPEVLAIMARIAARLALRGYTLRSGGADGADTAFEEGAGTAKEVFLPWPGFNGRDSPYPTPSANAYRVASALHPDGGSFTTAKAAERLGRRWLSTEIMLEYVVGAATRFSEASGFSRNLRMAA